MKLTAIKEIREVVGADATNELLQQGWVLLEVHSNHSEGREGLQYGLMYQENNRRSLADMDHHKNRT